MTIHAVRPAGAPPSATIKDWFENRTKRAAGLPACSAMPASGKTTITRHAIDELGLDAKNRDGSVPGGVLLCGLHRQGRAGDDAQGHAGLHHP